MKQQIEETSVSVSKIGNIMASFTTFHSRIDELQDQIKAVKQERVEYCRENVKEIRKLIPKKGELLEIIDPSYFHERYWHLGCEGRLFFRVSSQRFQPTRQGFYRVYPTVSGDILDENLNYIFGDDVTITNLRKTEKENETQIYLMIDKNTGYYKIGRSNNPLRRERTLQSQKPTIELIFHQTSTKDKEKELHRLFKDKRIRGEWFDLNGSDIQLIKNTLKATKRD